MRIISHRPRGGGKTTEAARMVREQNGILIVANSQLARDIARHHNLRPDQVMSFERLRADGLRGLDNQRPVIVDDADSILETLLQIRIDGVTMSTPRTRDGMSPGEHLVQYGQVPPAAPFIGIDMAAPARPARRPRPVTENVATDDPLENAS